MFKLEDDILTRDRFLVSIRSFLEERKNENWFMMEFSELGFIGKVFRSSDLTVCINFFLMFSSKQPIDLLIIKILETRACDLNKKTVSTQYGHVLLFPRFKSCCCLFRRMSAKRLSAR